MKRIAFLLAIIASPTYAQQAPQPITLTPEEYNRVMAALIQRDPIMSLLVDKQQKAQAETAQKAADLQKQLDAAKAPAQ